ncbi:hypothetical protein ACFL12_07850 [Pseudomonadota bacterium]
MAIDNINLRKLLGLFYLPPNKLKTELRKDIYQENKKKEGGDGGGGDFHIPFWSDAKAHVAGTHDLSLLTQDRIEKNRRSRFRLYPLLRDGFLQWWNEKRRWSNQEFELLQGSVKGRHQLPELDATVKVENILALKIDDDTHRLIYPYFKEEPRLQPEGARIGLWLLNATMNDYHVEDMRILDVLRSQSFSTSEFPLQGNEEELFISKYSYILEMWEDLKKEYPGY